MIHWRYSWTLFWVWMWRGCLRKFEIWQRWNHFLNWPRCKNGRRNWNSCRRFSSDSLIILSGWLSVQFCLRDSNRPTLTLSVRHFSNHFWMPIWIWQGLSRDTMPQAFSILIRFLPPHDGWRRGGPPPLLISPPPLSRLAKLPSTFI